MRAAATLFLLICALLAPLCSAADSPLHKLGDDLYAYISDNDASANATFLVAGDGILVVDTGLDATEGAKLVAAIRTVSPLPVRFIVNTHYHRDHQGANGIVGPDATVIASPWTRRRTQQYLQNDLPRALQAANGPALDSFKSSRFRLAQIAVSDEVTVYVGGHPVQVSFSGAAHTSGDVIVYFPDQHVVAMGDLFLNRCSPAMDDGSARNWIAILDRVLALPADTFVPGHFEVGRRSDMQRFRNYLGDLFSQVEPMFRAGASVEQVRQQISLPAYADFRQYPKFHATFADNAETIYRQLAREAGAR